MVRIMIVTESDPENLESTTYCHQLLPVKWLISS